MNERTKTGLEILQVALALGILGDIFLRSTPWGLNVLLFNLAFAAGMIVLLRRRAPEYLTGQTIALLGALIFFASMFVWRDSIELRIADTFAILTILSVLFVPSMKIAASVAGVFHYIVGFFWSSFNSLFAPAALLAVDIKWPDLPQSGWSRHLVSALRGVAIAAPLILIFGALFMAADAVYAGWVQRIFNFDPSTIFSHAILFAILSWLSAGYLRGILIRSPFSTAPDAAAWSMPTYAAPAAQESKVDSFRAESGEHAVTLPDNRSVVDHLNISDPPNTDAQARTSGRAEHSTQATAAASKTEQPKRWQWPNIDNTMLPGAFTLGSVEVGVILGLMNLLFLSFVIVQVPYLFGGMELVQNTPDFKLAEYARRGFGELVAVSALVLPILLVSHWLIRKETPSTEKLFRVFAGIQIALLFVIMASAAQRLVLLTGNLGYGMTTVRLYPLIVMAWLAVVFVWFGATVLCGSRQYFAWGALWSAFLILGATHVLNPDEFIVKHNISLMREGRPFDAKYNSELSDDALPQLLGSFTEFNETDQLQIFERLAERNCRKNKETDLRSWNASRQAASSALLPHQAVLTGKVLECEERD
jgi:hypothetical protein